MIKVLFSEEFNTRLESITDSIRFTELFLVSYTRPVEDINDLLEVSYVNEDRTKESIKNFKIIKNNSRSIQLSFNLENLSVTKNLLYVFSDLGKPVFVLFDNSPENRLNLEKQVQYILTIPTDVNIFAKLENRDEDLNLLENIGAVNSNQNFLTVSNFRKDIGFSNLQKYKDIQITNRVFSFNGHYTPSSFNYNKYRNLDITLSKSVVTESKGVVNVTGTAEMVKKDFVEFSQESSKENYNSIDLGEIPRVEIINEHPELVKLEYNQVEGKLSYESLTNNPLVKTSIKFRVFTINPFTREISHVDSNLIEFSIDLNKQISIEDYWRILDNQAYHDENDDLVFLFPNPKVGDKKSFRVVTKSPLGDDNGKLTIEDPILNEYFKISSKQVGSETLQVDIEVIKENTSSDTWIPKKKDNPIPCRLTFLDLKKGVLFYCILCPKISNLGIKLYRKDSSGFKEVTNIETDTSNIYYPSNSNKEFTDTFWQLKNNVPEAITTSSVKGCFNGNSSRWGSSSIGLSSVCFENSLGGEKFSLPGKVTFFEVPESKNTVDVTKWKDVVNLPQREYDIVSSRVSKSYLDIDRLLIHADKFDLYSVKLNVSGNYLVEIFGEDIQLVDPMDGKAIVGVTKKSFKVSKEGEHYIYLLIKPRKDKDRSIKISLVEDSSVFDLITVVKASNILINKNFFEISPTNVVTNKYNDLFLGKGELLKKDYYIEEPVEIKIEGDYLKASIEYLFDCNSVSLRNSLYGGMKKASLLIEHSKDITVHDTLYPTQSLGRIELISGGEKILYDVFLKKEKPSVKLVNESATKIYLKNDRKNLNEISVPIISNYELKLEDIEFIPSIEGKDKISFSIIKSGNNLYNLIIRSEKYFLNNHYLGKVSVKKELSKNEVLPDDIIRDYTKEKLSELLDVNGFEFLLYSLGESEFDLIGDTLDISPRGDKRRFVIDLSKDLSENNSSLKVINKPFSTTKSNLSSRYVDLEVFDRLIGYDKGLLSSDDSLYLSISKDRVVGFNATVINTETNRQYSNKIELIQRSIEEALLYSSKNQNSVLYLGDTNESEGTNIITESLSKDLTQFEMSLGNISIKDRVNPGKRGNIDSLEVIKEGGICSIQVLDYPTYYDTFRNSNIKVKFPKNQNPFSISRKLTIQGSFNNKSEVTLIQEGSTVYKSKNQSGKNIRLGYSGYIISDSGWGYLDEDIETNIPIDKLVVQCDFDKFSYHFEKSGVTGDDLIKYKLFLKVEDINLSSKERVGTVEVRYIDREINKLLWQCVIIQDYISLKIKDLKTDKEYINMTEIQSENNPIVTTESSKFNYKVTASVGKVSLIGGGGYKVEKVDMTDSIGLLGYIWEGGSFSKRYSYLDYSEGNLVMRNDFSISGTNKNFPYQIYQTFSIVNPSGIGYSTDLPEIKIFLKNVSE